MEIRSVQANKTIDIKDKVIFNKGDFTESFMKSYKSVTKEELENYIKDIKKKGNKLILTKSYSDIKSYKLTIKNYLKAVVDYTYILNKNIGFWENQYYSTVEVINEKLESLTNEVLSGEKENLDISSTIDNIQGLLIDIYK
ncbi:YaaR family protein [Clostridium sp. D53t1_180928_C8]|uniref:YaaR family protein n=1 Tax=Clostridium sp. D53t1_180928_C8 TaxID=2787101 RepID=UPI0018AABDF9|nr:YaaR family protein [Clostridium sp. D53t1_180928_C8]